MPAAAIKRYGPVNAPGVAIVEKTSGRAISAGELGGSVFVGQYRRGKVNTTATPLLNDCTSKKDFLKKCGDRFDAISMAPDAAIDFWDHSGGAGRVYAIRVTDGNEKSSSVTLYSRHWGAAKGLVQSLTDSQSQLKTAVLKITAANGGRWAGRRRVLDLDVPTNVATDVAETTVDIGSTAATAIDLKIDEFKGATIAFEGITGRTYEVTSNTAAGVFTVATGSTMSTDFNGGTNKHLTITLTPRAMNTGKKEGLAVRIKASNLDPANEFGLEVWVDGQLVGDYPSVSMDSTSSRYVEKVVEANTGNDEITVTDLITAGTTIVPDLRPAAFYGVPTAATATSLTLLVGQVVSVSDSKITVVDIAKSTVDPVPHRLTFTYVLASDKYTVAASQVASGVDLRNLADFTLDGAGERLHQTYSPGDRPTVSVTIDHTGGAPANGSTFVVDVLPLPKYGSETDNDVVGWYIYPDAKNKPFTSYLASEADVDSVTIASGDFTTVADASPSGATVTGTEVSTFDTTTLVKFKVAVDGGTAIEVSLTSGAATTAATICADINAAFAASLGYHLATPTSTGAIKLTSRGGAMKGSLSSIKILEASANDAAVEVLGFTVGTTTGSDGLAAGVATLEGSIVGTYDTSTNFKFKIQIDGRKAVEVSLTQDVALPIATVVTDINSAFDTAFGAGNLNPASATTDGRLKLTSPWFEGGPGSSVTVSAASGTDAKAILGFTTGTVRGFFGSECMLSFPAVCTGGYDGDTPTDQKYVDAIDIANSPLNQLLGQGRGVLQIACPGKTSTTIAKQLITFCEAKNYFGSYEIPDSVVTEQGAIDHCNTTIGRSDHVSPYFPSFVNVRDPDKDGPLKSVSVLGMVFGLDAATARQNGGYFVPAAGVGAILPKIVTLPTDDLVLNEEMLTPQGINVIKFKGANAIIWGARTLFESTDFAFKAHRLQFSHYEWTFVDNFDDVIFGLNTAAERNRLVARTRDFFRKEFAKGALDGATLEDAVTIKCDAENNTDASIAAGDMNMEIAIRLPGIAERLVITMSRSGVFEGAAT